MRSLVNINGVIYRKNIISDFDATGYETTKVELIKVLEASSRAATTPPRTVPPRNLRLGVKNEPVNNIRVIDATYTYERGDENLIACNTIGGGFAVTLSNDVPDGTEVTILQYGSNNITVSASSNSISGQASITYSANFESKTFVYGAGERNVWNLKYKDSNGNELIFVNSKRDLPDAVAGVITLADNITYLFTTTVDLTGDRLVCGENTTIIGGSSENCRIKSTGLTGTALITSVYSLPLRNITIEADVALDLDGDGVTTALDWFGVNFTDCGSVGTIKDYSNFIIADSAFLNSGDLTFDGTIGTIGISQCLFDCSATNTVFILPATLTITRRFRVIYSSFVIGSGETGINVDASATIPTEAYILDTVYFSGAGTYLAGLDHTSNDSLFTSCVGIINTAVNGQLYMQGNATATTVSATNTFYKVAGTTTASADNSKFSHSNNRLTCDAVINRKYLIQATLDFTAGNNNVCEFGFYDSQLAGMRTPSKTKSTANASGRAESITFFCVTSMDSGDFLEVHCANTSAITNITVENLNFIITEIK
jgi:hypothetical protein